MGGGVVSSMMQNSAQKDAQKANAEAAAAQTRFSPYTKMGAGSFQAKPIQSAVGAGLNGAMQGGVSGLQLSQSYNEAKNAQNMTSQNPNNMSMSNNQMASQINGLGSQLNNPYAMSYGTFGGRTGQG